MSDITDLVNEHYGSDDLIGKVLADLREAGKDPDALTRDDLAPFEEFHSGGRPTTHKLAKLLGLASGSHVLDVGAGYGLVATAVLKAFRSTERWWATDWGGTP